MSRFYRRKTPGARENLGAGVAALGIAAGVAAATFYFVRLFMAREVLESNPPSRLRGEAEEAAGGEPDGAAARDQE